MELNREQALDLLKKYNKEPFHIQHALTVEGVMRWFAQENGEDVDFWGLCGLLHDIDFEIYPEQHCQKAPELLAEVNASAEMVHAICSHGYGICSDVEPVHLMEKIMFTVDELTGLIGAAARMRPSKSVMDMELSSLKKKFKDKKFAELTYALAEYEHTGRNHDSHDQYYIETHPCRVAQGCDLASTIKVTHPNGYCRRHAVIEHKAQLPYGGHNLVSGQS